MLAPDLLPVVLPSASVTDSVLTTDSPIARYLRAALLVPQVRARLREERPLLADECSETYVHGTAWRLHACVHGCHDLDLRA